MSRSRHIEAQIIPALKQIEAGRTAEDAARELWGVQAHDLRLEGEVGGMEASETQKPRALEDKNGRLKRLVPDLSLDGETLKASKSLRRTKEV